MSAVDVLDRLLKTCLLEEDLKYCLVSSDKKPYKIDGTLAKPNVLTDFVDSISLLQCDSIGCYAGVGISIQASNVCAIDVDHCFSEPFVLESADDRANDILEMFADEAYCEFSFSGTGLRILFRMPLLDDYSDKYYIKNERYGIEFYQPSRSFRYVTITGMTISNNGLSNTEIPTIVMKFLDKYMQRPVRVDYTIHTQPVETRSFEMLMAEVKRLYFKDHFFQEMWFAQAPGSGKDESEKDFKLIATLYERVTQDKDMIKRLFESSFYFKSKDSKHKYKWSYQDGRYYNYVYDMIRRTKQ